MTEIKNLIKGWKRPLKISPRSQSRKSDMENLSERMGAQRTQEAHLSSGGPEREHGEGEGGSAKTIINRSKAVLMLERDVSEDSKRPS